MAIYLLSDLHLFHDKEFLYTSRGFRSVEEMNDTIINNIVKTIGSEDDFYLLGDVALGTDMENIEETVSLIPGRIHLMIGNHDSKSKVALYESLPNFVEVAYATIIRGRKQKEFYLSHYPTNTTDDGKRSGHIIFDIHGHVHSPQKFIEDRWYQYNVCCEAQNCTPALFDNVYDEIIEKFKNCEAD